MAHIEGISGVFVRTNDPATLADWYMRAFGMSLSLMSDGTYYMEFFHRDDADTSVRHIVVFAIMPARKPLGVGRGEYTINYRTDDLTALMAHLETLGTTCELIEEGPDGRYPGSIGRFTRLYDPDGNHIELYQPL